MNTKREWIPIPFRGRSAARGPARRAAAPRAALLLLALALALADWGSGPARAGQQGVQVEILAAGDLRGEIKPCGCSPEGQLGGLPRRLSFLERAFAGAKGPPPILVDLGNNFPEPSDQGALKIDLIQDLLKQYPPAAILPGPNEFAVGLSALERTLPYVVSNDTVGRIFRPSVTLERAGLRIGIYGYLSPGAVYQEFADQYRLVPADAAWFAALRERMRAAGQARAILLFRGGDGELETIAKAKLFDLIVVGNPFADELNQVVRRKVDGAELAQVPTKGQGFHRIPLALDGAPGAAPPPEPVWLSEIYPDHPVAVHAFGIYDDKVKGLFFARLQTMEQGRAESPYAGAGDCAMCHIASNEILNKSGHAHALATLERVGKQFDPECLACHVVGLGERGFLSRELTPHLANVQCENCHGPGRKHMADPANVKLGLIPKTIVPKTIVERDGAEATCRICHYGSHSPTFDYSTYWPKISHKWP